MVFIQRLWGSGGFYRPPSADPARSLRVPGFMVALLNFTVPMDASPRPLLQ
jgi:hypothetical protein